MLKTIISTLSVLAAAGLSFAATDQRDWTSLVFAEGQPTLPTGPAVTANPPAAPASDQPKPFIHNRDSIPERPDIVFPFDGRYQLETRTDVDGGPASLRVQRSAFAGNLIFGPEHDLQISFPVDWETSTYAFRDANSLFPGGTSRVRNVQQIVFSPNIEVKINDHWGVFGGGLLFDAGQYDANGTTTFGGFGGAIWRPDKTLTLRIGLGARTQLEDSLQVLPVIWMEWKLDERTRLTSQGNNIRFEYDINEAWCIKVDLAYETRAYRFNESSPGARAVMRDDQIPLTARIEFVPHAATRFEAWIGANVYRQFTVDLEKDNRFSRFTAKPSLLVGISFEIIF